MKTIVAFGDSLTWGYDPADALLPPGGVAHRFADEVRWTGVLAAALGAGYQVITEGLCGRTTVWDDPVDAYRCSKEQLVPVLDSQAPLDLVIIMLGTNDLKSRFAGSAFDIACGAGLLVEQALSAAAGDFNGPPKVLLVAPPHLGEKVDESSLALLFAGALAESKKLAAYYQAVASQYGVAFFDAAQVVKASAIDQVHLDADQHKLLGQALAPVVRQLLVG